MLDVLERTEPDSEEAPLAEGWVLLDALLGELETLPLLPVVGSSQSTHGDILVPQGPAWPASQS
jgi:hypothetical protein